MTNQTEQKSNEANQQSGYESQIAEQLELMSGQMNTIIENVKENRSKIETLEQRVQEVANSEIESKVEKKE